MGTKQSGPPQAANKSVSSAGSNHPMAAAQPQPVKQTMAGNQAPAATNRAATASLPAPAATPQIVPKPQPVTNRTVVIQSSVRGSAVPAQPSASQSLQAQSVPNVDVSELHFTGPKLTTAAKGRTFKWKKGALISVPVAVLAIWYVRRRGGFQTGKASKSAFPKPTHIAITDFPNQ